MAQETIRHVLPRLDNALTHYFTERKKFTTTHNHNPSILHLLADAFPAVSWFSLYNHDTHSLDVIGEIGETKSTTESHLKNLQQVGMRYPGNFFILDDVNLGTKAAQIDQLLLRLIPVDLNLKTLTKLSVKQKTWFSSLAKTTPCKAKITLYASKDSQFFIAYCAFSNAELCQAFSEFLLLQNLPNMIKQHEKNQQYYCLFNAALSTPIKDAASAQRSVIEINALLEKKIM